MEQGRNRKEIHLDVNEEMFIRTGSILKHPSHYSLVTPHKLRLPFSRLWKQLFFLFKVVGEDLTLTTPFEDAYISEITLEEDDALIIKMDHILAFSANSFIQQKWKFDFVSLFSWQFRYIYVSGPARVIFFGLGELGQERLENASSDYDRGSVIGWSNSLSQSVTSRSSMFSALLAKEQICLSHFKGNGTLLTQASTITKLPKRFHDEKGRSSWVDYLNALLGLGL